jgi:tetratricopeptide (TPR) repeat protein
MNQNDSVRSYYQLALKSFEELNDKGGQLLCYQNFGSLDYDYSDFGKAITNYELSVQLAIEMHDKTNEAKGYHNLAEVYTHIGDNAKATELLFKSIKIKEQLQNKLSLAQGYMGIGELYYNLNEYPKARIYFEKSLKINIDLKNPKQIGRNLNNIAALFCAENRPDSAMIYYNKALPYYLQTENYFGISNLYINMGAEFAKSRDYPLAEKYFLKALKEKTKLSDLEGYAIVNHHLANLYFDKAPKISGQSKIYLDHKAEKAGLESYNTANRIGTIPVRRDASLILKKIYQKQGNYSEALKYSDIYNSLSDSLLSKNKIQALTFAEARWNVEKKQQEIDNLEKTRQLQLKIIQQNKIEARQHKLIIWFIVGLFILAGISTQMTHLYLRKRRDTIYQKQLASITALRMQNTRNTMSPHFFLNILASLTGLFGQPIQLKEKMENLTLVLRRMIENIDRMAIPLNDELKAVKAYIDLCSNQISGNFIVEFAIQDGTNLDGLIPAMMIQIPVENAIKHGLIPFDGDKVLTISIADLDGFQQITITDNGIGLQAAAGQNEGTRTGIKVLLQTIHLLNASNKNKINFSISDRQSDNKAISGTVVEIKIPTDFTYTL